MAKPKRARYSGIGIFANQWLLSRAQTLSTDTDLSEEEIKELTNQEVVEYAAQTPSVSITIDTNEYGSMRNIRSICNITGLDEINVNTFDGLSTDINIMVEEDNVLARTLCVNDAFVTSISWSFDVGGSATENFTFEADNKNWYLGANREAYTFTSIDMDNWPEVTGDIASSGYFFIDVSNSDIVDSGDALKNDCTVIGAYVDGIAVTNEISLIASGDPKYEITGAEGEKLVLAYWQPTGTCVASGTRHRLVVYRTTPVSTISQTTDASTIGGITRGMIDLYLVSGLELDPYTGFGSEGETNLLRLQSLTIDADLSREVLEELGHYRSYDRSLTYPVPVNITFSALSSDLEEWAKFQAADFSTATNLGIGSFTKTASIQVRICDKKDTESDRSILKTLTVSGIQLVSESFGVDVGGNATQDYTAKGSNFLLSGAGIPA